MDLIEKQKPNTGATGIAFIPTKGVNLRVSEKVKKLAEAKAETFEKGMTDVLREALYHYLNDPTVPEGYITPDDKPITLFSIIPDPDDIQNRNASIDATVSLDVKFFFRDLSNKTGVLQGELLGELARLYTMHQIGLLQSTHESPIIKIDVTHDDLVMVDTLFGECETQHYSDFMLDVFRAGLQQKQKELSINQEQMDEIIFDDKIEEKPVLDEKENKDEYDTTKSEFIDRIYAFFYKKGDDPNEAKRKANVWMNVYGESLFNSPDFVLSIIDTEVFMSIIEDGFNEDRYMTLERESDAKKQFEQLLNDKLEKQASEYEVKIKALAAEAHEGKKHRDDLTDFINKTRELIGYYEESTSLKGMFTKYSRNQLVSMFPEEYRHLLA